MNRLSHARRTEVLRCLVEGNSVRSTNRITGVAQNTISKLLLDIGEVCRDYQDRHLRNLRCRLVQVDEIWSFVEMKQKRVPEDRREEFGVGDVWTWVALDAETKLVPAYRIGRRDGCEARAFVMDIARRMSGRIQLTSDGHKPYLEAVEFAFGGQVDYAMLVKEYASDAVQRMPERRYSPGDFVTCHKVPIVGEPAWDKIGTSFVESQNLTIRMKMRRFTRLTNAFSRSVDHHRAAIHLHFMHYNFVHRHKTLRRPPALAAGVTDRRWNLGDVVTLLEEREAAEIEGSQRRRAA